MTLNKQADLYEKWCPSLRGENKRRKKQSSGEPGMGTASPTEPPTNGEINVGLQELLQGPIRTFFSHHVAKQFLSEMEDLPYKLPFLFIVDEAAYLQHTDYMHCFMWVLDNPVVKILRHFYNEGGDEHMPTDQFFVLMLGTHSQIVHFALNEIYPSERTAGKPQLLPSPFISFNWDENVREFSAPFCLRDSERFIELAQWGRSMWGPLFSNCSNPAALRNRLHYLQVKLKPAHNAGDRENELSKLAVMSIRLHLDVDCASPTRASQLVSSKMRWLADVGAFRRHITTTYGSEPLLVEAAACMMNSNQPHGSVSSYVELMFQQLSQGYISRGHHGELTARVLCTYRKQIILTASDVGERLSYA